MSLRRYPSYEDSGVEWLGEVPAHWDVTRLKFIAGVQGGIAKGKDTTGQETVRLPYLRVANVQDGYLDLAEIATIEIPASEIGRYLLKPGDVLMNEGGDFDKLGRGYIWRGEIAPCSHQNHVFAVRPHCVSPEWLNAITGSAYAQFYFKTRSKQSTNLASISSTNLMELSVILPPAKEQEAILLFLDRETAKIDALMAEQQRLIKLLVEKRQAVISHAVTKGLNPAAPMKDSAVAWLGDVPAHWNIKRLCVVSEMIQTGPFGSQLHSEDYVEDETPVINPSNIRDGQIIPDLACTVGPLIAERLNHHRLKEGDIVFARRGEMGRCARVSAKEVGWLCGTGSITVRLDSSTISEFVSMYLGTPYVRELLRLESVGSTMDNLNTSILSRIPIPVPPVGEQAKIATFLDLQTGKLEALTTEAQTAIALLQERRISVISAAVTGRIDVRNLATTGREKEAAA